jgi:hypothetical protein
MLTMFLSENSKRQLVSFRLKCEYNIKTDLSEVGFPLVLDLSCLE